MIVLDTVQEGFQLSPEGRKGFYEDKGIPVPVVSGLILLDGKLLNFMIRYQLKRGIRVEVTKHFERRREVIYGIMGHILCPVILFT